jgi:DNA-binding NarL/FixJ family response regulator
VILSQVELGGVAANRGDPSAANDLLAQALETARSSGHEGLAAQALMSAAEVAIRVGESQRAASMLREASGFFVRVGRRHGLARCLERFAWIAAAHQDHTRVALLLAAASSIREQTGAAAFPQERSCTERAEQSAKAALGGARFATLWAEGRHLPADVVVELAVHGQPVRRAHPANLTNREVEVLRLLALGASVSRIAAALTISPHTSKRHVANIYDKLGVASRHEATLRAHELGIV